MTPVSVVHVCDKFGVAGSSIHGVSRLFSWWFPRYDKGRFDVSLVGLKRPEPASLLLAREGVPVHHLNRGRFDPRILSDLVALARDRRARILHVHGYAAADFGRLAARRVGAALVLHEHFADPHMPAYQAWADRLLARYTDRAIAVSRSTRDFLVDERFVPAERVRLIWNGAPLDEFARPAPGARESVRRELGLSPDTLAIGTIGRLSAQKGQRDLLDAAAQATREFRDIRFVLVGDGDLRPELEAQAAALGLGDRVLFAGHRADIPAVLAAIDVLCISSTYEGTPLALFEAMAAGKPIVSTAVDGCREVLVDDVTGLLTPPQDPDGLARALVRMRRDADLRRRLGAAAAAESARYDIAECVRRIESLYDEVLAERGAAA
ncbi:MAG TPA: glycosyltransferase [Vicinamibacteria bacterium]|nr:glycosyltransferase [Vicinamibacteria bacterium]